MEKRFAFRRTCDLSAEQQNQIMSLFYSVFAREMSQEIFNRRFLYSAKGFSYHGLMLNGDEIVGSFSAIPYRYKCYGKEQTFALSVDTMIAPQHRGGKTNIITMANLVYEALVKDDIKFIYGFPNELYYAHEKRIVGTQDIGKLDYYVLPVNAGTAIHKFKAIDYLSRLFTRMILKLPVSKDSNAQSYDIEKINDELFIKHRYDNSYTFMSLKNGARCVFKPYLEKGDVRTLHLLDVWPMSPASMDEAILEIFKRHGNSIDLFIYVGKLPFRPRRLVKVPQHMEPQKIRLTGKMLVENAFPDSIFDISNWNVNVSNFDVR